MLSLGSIAFLQPWFLAGLAALPLLWLLLRAVPPSPKLERFPGIRVLLGLEDKERTPQRTPWWLLLLRMLIAAALLLAFAEPLLNPKARLTGKGPLLIVMDGGWGDASAWRARQDAALDAVAQARRAERLVAFIDLSDPDPAPERITFLAPEEAAEAIEALEPAPWRPEPARFLPAVRASEAVETVWAHDGLSHDGAAELAAALAAKGPLRLIGPEAPPIALSPPALRDGALLVPARRAVAGAEETVSVSAFGRDAEGVERRLAAARADFAEGETQTEARIELPGELRNRLSRLEISNAGHAGAAVLLDDRWRRRSVALISGEGELKDQPLLSGLHYLRAALEPHASYRETTLDAALGLETDPFAALTPAEADVAAAEADALEGWADAIVLSDIGRFDAETEARLTEWVEGGGLLIRFAGPQLASAAADDSEEIGRGREEPVLLPTRLRGGGRALGGALSWSTPQGLRPFSEESPFAGLPIPEDVTVERQVLAEPSAELADRVWASLEDGTPLVTAKAVGEGRVVLIHVTASAAWSSLPLSGLFVEMMGRMVSEAPALAASRDALSEDAALWSPERLMDGFGRVAAAGGDATPRPGADLAEGVRVGVAPGVYLGAAADGGELRLALSAVAIDDPLNPRAAAPSGAFETTLSGDGETAMKPWLLGFGLLLLALDALAALFVSGRLNTRRRSAAAGLAVGLLALGAAVGGAPMAAAQAQDRPAATPVSGQADEGLSDIVDPAERRAALESVLAYVVTGDPSVDRISAAGMLGLSATLFQRTAIEPDQPAGVDLETDEIAVYTVLYWPVTRVQETLSDAAVRKLNAFLRTGGLLIVDTRDAHQTFGAAEGPNAVHLRRLLSRLDLPPLAPVPSDHVLMRSFYLLDDLPGRWAGGAVWVEARRPGVEINAQRPVNANDGVSPVIVGAADWASAWAVDDTGRSLFTMGRGGEGQRETAYRFGVNAVMYAFTGNYKSDQVHIPALLDRLGN